MIQVIVQSLGIDQLSKDPVVILQEREGDRVLPIWIGHGEASAIAMELAGMKFARPLTHDLTASLIRALGGSLTRVRITRVKENTYFAELMIRRGDQVISVDARPSDSIAIALRLKAPIFASDDLLGPSSLELQPSDADALPAAPEEDATGGGLTPEQLKEYIRGLKPEDLGRFNP